MQKRQELSLVQTNIASRHEAVDRFATDTARGSTLLQICWRRRFTVLITLTCALFAGGVYWVFAPRIYTSTSRLYVDQNGPRILTSDPDGSIAESEAYLLRQCEIIRSEALLNDAIQSTHADQMRTFAGSSNVLRDLQNNLDVSIGKKDEILTIQVNSRYPDDAATLVNAIVAAYQAFQSHQSQSSATEVLTILRTEKQVQEDTLDNKLKEMVAYKQDNGEMFLTTEKGIPILSQNLATISDQLIKARLAADSYYALYVDSNNKLQAEQMWKTAQTQVDEYEREYDTEKQKALKLNAVQAEYQKLQLEVDRTTKLCDLLDTRIKELSVDEHSGALTIQVLDTGKPEEKPTSPRKTVILLTALALGLAAGCGLAALRDWTDQRIRMPDEGGRLLGISVLGLIPRANSAMASVRQELGRAVHLAPNSEIAEAFRTLRAAIQFGWPTPEAKSMLITSPDRDDGKSTICTNLAIAMAQAGHKTLLIDADLRKPVQHKMFDVPCTVGLSDVVARGARIEQAIQQTEIEGLSLLPCGTTSQNPSEITNSQAFGRLLQRLETQYDLIVIDSPPLLAVADARILGAQAGLTVLVARADKSTRQDIRQACQQLVSVGGSLLGIVLNDVQQRQRTYGFYHEELELHVPMRRQIDPAHAASGGLLTQADPGDFRTKTY